MKHFWIHLGSQLGMAAAGALVSAAAGADYSGLGVWAGVAQGAAAVGAEIFNQFGGSPKAASTK